MPVQSALAEIELSPQGTPLSSTTGQALPSVPLSSPTPLLPNRFSLGGGQGISPVSQGPPQAGPQELEPPTIKPFPTFLKFANMMYGPNHDMTNDELDFAFKSWTDGRDAQLKAEKTERDQFNETRKFKSADAERRSRIRSLDRGNQTVSPGAARQTFQKNQADTRAANALADQRGRESTDELVSRWSREATTGNETAIKGLKIIEEHKLNQKGKPSRTPLQVMGDEMSAVLNGEKTFEKDTFEALLAIIRATGQKLSGDQRTMITAITGTDPGAGQDAGGFPDAIKGLAPKVGIEFIAGPHKGKTATIPRSEVDPKFHRIVSDAGN